jgi:hypothetical protein
MRPYEPSQVNAVQTYQPPPCPHCGGRMGLARIEPAPEPDHDVRTFECIACGHADTLKVRYC